MSRRLNIIAGSYSLLLLHSWHFFFFPAETIFDSQDTLSALLQHVSRLVSQTDLAEESDLSVTMRMLKVLFVSLLVLISVADG